VFKPDVRAAIEKHRCGAGADTLIGNAVNKRDLGSRWRRSAHRECGQRHAQRWGDDDTYVFDADVALGTDTITDSLGVDILDFSETAAGVTVNLGTTGPQTVVPAKLVLNLTSTAEIENVTGGSGNDSLTGNSLSNVFAAVWGRCVKRGAGDDTYVRDESVLLGHDTITDPSVSIRSISRPRPAALPLLLT